MTNEEILKKYEWIPGGGWTKEGILSAMDLARKDEAGAFGEWMDREGKFYSRSETIAQLYSIFKQQN